MKAGCLEPEDEESLQAFRRSWSVGSAMFRITVRLRRESTLSIKEIAVRMHLGTSNTANARLHNAMKALGLAGSSPRSVGI